MSELSFPRQWARTARFTHGEPRNFTASSDGRRLIFCRSGAGDDPVNSLWVFDLAAGVERLVADPRELLQSDEASELTDAERLRRERLRDQGGGVTSYATDAPATVAAFALAGRLFVAGLISGNARELRVDGPVFDPRPDPMAQRVAYVSGDTVRIGELDGRSWELIGPDPGETEVSWGSAEFIAAEEMGRHRGYWWSPDGTRIAVARVDNSPVQVWNLSDPTHPEQLATTHRYPAAGTDNAIVGLFIADVAGPLRTPPVAINWDHDEFPYLAGVTWDGSGLAVTVQSRDQRDLLLLLADPNSGDTTVVYDDHDEQWIELVPGSPQMTSGNSIIAAAERGGSRRIVHNHRVISPADIDVRAILYADDDSVTYEASVLVDPSCRQVFTTFLNNQVTECLTPGRGVFSAVVGPRTTLVRASSLDEPGSTTTVGEFTIRSNAERPNVVPRVTLYRVGDDELSVAVCLPTGWQPGSHGSLPVLMDPYGGPHAQRVTASHNAYLQSQWFADQGFAVVIVDGRGTPGRGSEWDRAVFHDLAGPVLEDQVRGLQGVAALLAEGGVDLDLDRVGIRGWSFGGYLAALAVMRRPDVFHAAVAGAPVTEWRLYDTHYTERYLGDPLSDPEPYDVSSLLGLADQLTRPLLLVHGLADDNVVAAHSLQLSSALFAAGKMHEVLPLSGVTHMASQEVVAENLLLHQVGFVRRSLGLAAP